MEDDEQYVRLNMDNDYEGGEWIGGEFFYRSKRQKTQTEDDKLYGVFAGNDSSDDERRGRGPRKPLANYSKPVAFVSTGRMQTDTTEEKESGAEVVKKEDSGDDVQTIGPMKPPKEESSDMEVEDGVLPTALGRRIRDAAAKRHREHKEKVELGKAWKDAEKAGFGTFEKHTKGIGAKLLAKMGYKPGQGLGRDGAGITKPIEQRLRPKGMGMGFGEYREHGMALVADADKIVKEEAQMAKAQKVQPKEKLWKKRHGAERKKRVYRTPEDLLAQEEERPSLCAQPVIDMRGPQARVVTNLEHLNVEEAEEDNPLEKVPMPELQHNMKLLVDMAEADIKRVDVKLRHKEDEAVMLGREEKRLVSEVEIRSKEAERLQALLEGISEISQLNAMSDLAGVQKGYKALLENFQQEYTLYGIAATALGQILVPFQRLFAGWDPLENPSHGLLEVLNWRDLLLNSAAQREAIFEDVASPEPFTILICEALVPSIRSAITNRWEPRNPEPLIRLVETWESIWPSSVLSHVLDALVFPKLRALVEVWEPRQERIAVHVWMHPWLPYLGERMADLYPTIVFRLSTALQSWHASDGSAFALLSPWHQVFSEHDWENLLLRSIIPKLAFALQELVINPVAQDLKPIHWVMQWKDVIPLKHMVPLLESQFFPKWLQVLHQWLSNNPNYEEVTQWYLGWKEIIPEHIGEDSRIAAQLGNALSMMNCAVDGTDLPSLAGYNTGLPSNRTPAAAPSGIMEPSENYSLRELVQHFAEENNVEFMPKAGRQHDGLQVYGFGQVNCILENIQNVVRAQIHHQWVSVTLTRLLEEHRARAAKGFQG
ncbi:hypothetical protein BSKO_09777 [Bryopsis sp. KO-2023]|nr:hypothetical protein BSKO_09777 [Bryopsis sp. KO-2023]